MSALEQVGGISVHSGGGGGQSQSAKRKAAEKRRRDAAALWGAGNADIEEILERRWTHLEGW